MTSINILQKNWYDFIKETLWWFYHLDKCHTRDIKFLNDWKVEVFFEFTKYKKVISPLLHVSGNLIHEAVMEWVYLAIRHAIIQWNINIWFTDEDFLASRAIALWREINLKFKKEVYQNTRVSLIFQLKNSKNLRTQFSISTIQFSWFVEWNAKAVISLREKIQETLDL